MNETRGPSENKGLRGMGRTLRRGNTWWIAYYFNGKEIRESSKSQREADARRLLKKRMKEIHGSRFVGPQEERLTVDDLREIDSAASKITIQGARYPEHLQRMVGR